MDEDSQTIDLLRTIGYPGRPSPGEISATRDLYTAARKNKIGSEYVRSLKEGGQLNGLENKWQNRREYQDNINTAISGLPEVIPEDANYALVKSTHSFWADSKDIDIILFDNDLDLVKRELINEGYQFCGDSPTSVDVIDPETEVQLDIQSQFSLQRVIYFKKETLETAVAKEQIAGALVPVVMKPENLALMIIHSLTEQLFILKEYYAALYALESFSERDFNRFIQCVEANDIGPACRAFFTLVDELTTEVFQSTPPYLDTILEKYPPYEFERQTFRENEFLTPHQYTRQSALRTVAGKLSNIDFLLSLSSQAPHLLRPSKIFYVGSQLLERQQREHYVHDTSDFDEEGA